MATTTTTILNSTYENVTSMSTGPLDVGNYDEIIFSCNCNQNTDGIWKMSRLDAFNTPFLFQEGPLGHGNQSINTGPSSVYNLSNQFGDLLQIDIEGANGSVTMQLCVTGKAYS